jgi:hypothetical protein
MIDMPYKIHTDLTPEHWFNFSTLKQMANIGCDIQRTIDWKKRNEPELSQNAFFRALELIDFTKADPKHRKTGRLKEICRVREVMIDHFMYDNIYNTTDEQWYSYFYYFMYAAALERGL